MAGLFFVRKTDKGRFSIPDGTGGQRVREEGFDGLGGFGGGLFSGGRWHSLWIGTPNSSIPALSGGTGLPHIQQFLGSIGSGTVGTLRPDPRSANTGLRIPRERRQMALLVPLKAPR